MAVSLIYLVLEIYIRIMIAINFISFVIYL